MTDPAPTADDLWEWLLACTRCGKRHEYRPATCGCGREMTGRMTWASPDDGHSYERRGCLSLHSLLDLRALWDTEQAEKATR